MKEGIATIDITKNMPLNKVAELGKDCKKCGHCCSFNGGILLDEDISRIADFLKISKNEFKEKYTNDFEIYNKKLKRIKSEKNNKPYGACLFYDFKEDCMIHEAKPLHCKIMNCSMHSNALHQWFLLNHCVDENDPVSVRHWAIFTKLNNVISGGKVDEIVKDKEKLRKIMSFGVLGN